MVAVKSTLEKPDVEQILAYYDVGVIEDVKAFTTGTVQTNILLHTTCGRFVLRYYERNRSFNSVLFEVNPSTSNAKTIPAPLLWEIPMGSLLRVTRTNHMHCLSFLREHMFSIQTNVRNSN